MATKPRLTIGCRARILTLKEMPKRTGPGFCANEDSWREMYGGHDVLLTKRSSSGDFAAMVLGKGVKILEKEKTGIVINRIAWVDEDNMERIDMDFDTNLDFMDWYQQYEDNFCPDCLTWFPDYGKDKAICPNKECYSNNMEKYEVLF